MTHDSRRKRMLDSPEGRNLVAKRWRISLVLTTVLFVLYYGYILLIALNPSLVSRTIGGVTPVGIPLGAAVIVGSWVT